MVFKIGNTDYSDKVLMDTYNVNRLPMYTEWEDAWGTKHRSVYRQKIQGSFDMLISKMTDYTAFLNDINRNYQAGNYISCKVAVNNLNYENVNADLFIDFTPVRTMNSNYTKGYMSFTVTIEER